MNAQTARREATKRAKSLIPKEVMDAIERAVYLGESEVWVHYESWNSEPNNLYQLLVTLGYRVEHGWDGPYRSLKVRW